MVTTLHSTETRKWIHDLRNGINTLRLCTSALEVCDETGEQVELLGDIEKAADNLTRLTEHIPSELTEADAI